MFLTEATGYFFQEFEVDWQHLHLIISIIVYRCYRPALKWTSNNELVQGGIISMFFWDQSTKTAYLKIRKPNFLGIRNSQISGMKKKFCEKFVRSS